MNSYQVTYQQGDEIASVLVEASGPVEAERAFRAERAAQKVTILCVVRQ